MDTIKIESRKSKKRTEYKQVLVPNATHEALLQISKDTGISMSKLVTKMIEFCADKIEIEK